MVQQKNTFGFVRAQAHKIGVWDDAAKRFKLAKWLPQPNAPVFRLKGVPFQPTAEAVGHFPGTNYCVTLRSVSALVTHNTAILGILGVGKSTLAIELVERMIVAGIKVVCIDLTNQYAEELAAYIDTADDQVSMANLQRIGRAGRTRVQQNVEDGGSRREFAAAVAADIAEFLKPSSTRRLKVYNPSHFEVWRQDSRPFQNTASMASLSPAEITHIISDGTLQACIALGMTEQARACLVYEEAHSLVPEWTSTVAEGDRAASNGSARAILQGRKFGLGCLLVTQRTANVTKSILNQCNTIFAMRTFDETGKEFLANYLGREYADMLPALQERHAIVFGRASACENPILMRVNNRADFLGAFRTLHPPPALQATTATTPSSESPRNTGAAAPSDDDAPF
jgi:DNA helicase HerA-like ATPase